MGGASMQIAYEVPPDLSPPKDLILPFTIGGSRTYNVCVMTFLGYGIHAAKSRAKQLSFVDSDFLGTGDMALYVEYQKNLLQKQNEYWYTSSDLGTTASGIYAFDTLSYFALVNWNFVFVVFVISEDVVHIHPSLFFVVQRFSTPGETECTLSLL
ncbi:hypothetical protein Aperf_G00000084096 [Anoplocephala perfoliata]